MNIIDLAKNNLLVVVFGGAAAIGGLSVLAYQLLTKRTQEVGQNILGSDDALFLGLHAPDVLPADDRTYSYESSSTHTAEESIASEPEHPNNMHSAYTIYRAFQVTQALTRVLLEMVPDSERSNPLTKECLDEMEKIIKENREPTKTLIETGGLLLKYLADLKQSNREAFDALMLGIDSGINQARNNPEFIHDVINVAGEFAKYFEELNRAKPAESVRVLQYLVDVTKIFSERPQLIEGVSKGAFCVAETLYEFEKNDPEQYKRMCRGAERLILGMGSSPQLVRDVTKVAATAAAAVEEYASSSSDDSNDFQSAINFVESITEYAAEHPQTVEKVTKLTLKAASKMEEIKDKDPELAQAVKEKFEEVLDELDQNPEKVDEYLEMGAGLLRAMIRWEKRLKHFDPKDAAEMCGAFDLDTDAASSSEPASKELQTIENMSESVKHVLAETLSPRDRTMLAVMAQVGIKPDQIFAQAASIESEKDKRTSEASSSSSSDDSSWSSSDSSDSSSPSPSRDGSSTSDSDSTSILELSPEVSAVIATVINSSPEAAEALSSCLGDTGRVMRVLGVDPMDVLKK